MKKEQKRLFKIINTMNEDGKPTKIIKKTLNRLIGTKEATDWLLGLEEDPAMVSAMTSVARLAYGLMGQIEELENTIKTMDDRMAMMQAEIHCLQDQIDSLKKG